MYQEDMKEKYNQLKTRLAKYIGDEVRPQLPNALVQPTLLHSLDKNDQNLLSHPVDSEVFNGQCHEGHEVTIRWTNTSKTH